MKNAPLPGKVFSIFRHKMVNTAPSPMGPREVDRCAHILALILVHVAPYRQQMTSAIALEDILLKKIAGMKECTTYYILAVAVLKYLGGI